MRTHPVRDLGRRLSTTTTLLALATGLTTGVATGLAPGPTAATASAVEAAQVALVVDDQSFEATEGTPFSARLVARGATGDVVWRLQPAAQLPPGVRLSRAGELSGSPTFAGEYPFAVTAEDDTGSATGRVVVRVDEVEGGVVVERQDLALEVGEPVDEQLVATGGTGSYSWKVSDSSSLPAWASLSRSGRLSGTPPREQVSAVAVIATDGTSRGRGLVVLEVVDPEGARDDLRIATGPRLPVARVAQRYRADVRADGATAPVAWSRAGGRLPAGLSWRTTRDGDLRISGRPRASAGPERGEAVARTAVRFRVRDAGGRSDVRRFVLRVRR